MPSQQDLPASVPAGRVGGQAGRRSRARGTDGEGRAAGRKGVTVVARGGVTEQWGKDEGNRGNGDINRERVNEVCAGKTRLRGRKREYIV